MTALILLGVIIGACVFAAMATAPHCEPPALKAANEAEREALRNTLRREALDASCLVNCSAESDADDCRRCGELIAKAIRSEQGETL